MAEIGSGDPRWIVKDREDGANCNNWHWTEKNIMPWAQTQLKETLGNGTFVSTKKIDLKTTEVSNIEGDCIIMNRKKKLICTFDVSADIAWEGSVKDEETGEVIYTVKGKMTVPDVDDTCADDKDLQVDVTCSEEGDAAKLVIAEVRGAGRDFVRKGIREFAALVKDTHGVANKATTITDNSAAKSPKKEAEKKEEKASSNSCVDEFKLRMDWRCPPAELWDALVNPAKASAYTRSQVTLDLKEGGAFSYLGGSIQGTFQSVDAPKGFVMKWRLDNWDKNHYSLVELTLDSHEAGATEMKVVHSNIPYVCSATSSDTLRRITSHHIYTGRGAAREGRLAAQLLGAHQGHLRLPLPDEVSMMLAASATTPRLHHRKQRQKKTRLPSPRGACGFMRTYNRTAFGFESCRSPTSLSLQWHIITAAKEERRGVKKTEYKYI